MPNRIFWLHRRSNEQQSPNANRVGRKSDAEGGIAEQGASDASPLVGAIHSEARQYNNRNRIGHIPLKPSWSAFDCDRSGRQGVEADHAVRCTNDISTGCTARLVAARAALQPVIKRVFS